MPRFSVVIPAYNAQSTIAETIDSVLAQTEANFELIVVDDGSADGTAAVVERFVGDPRVNLVRQENQGTAAARNTGIAHTHAAYVSFLDNDDLWLPGYLEEMAAALDAAPAAGFAYCDAWGFDDATLRVNRQTELHYRPGPPPDADREQTLIALARANFVMSSATVRREALAEAGGFDTAIRGTDDYDLWLRIVLAGHGAVRAGSAPLLLQRGRADSVSKDERMMFEGVREVLKRALDSPAMPAEGREIASGRLTELDRDLGDANPVERAVWAARARVVALRNRLLFSHEWRADPPPEVAAAFPQLRPRKRR